jgi:hypothetical protein
MGAVLHDLEHDAKLHANFDITRRHVDDVRCEEDSFFELDDSEHVRGGETTGRSSMDDREGVNAAAS